MSQSHSTPRPHQTGSCMFGCQRSRGTLLKQAKETSCQMQPALYMMQKDAGDLGGPRVTLQELWAQSCRWGQAEGHKEKARGNTKGRLVNWFHGAASATGALGLAALAGCWSSSCCWLWPKELGLNLFSTSAAHGQPSWAGTASHCSAQSTAFSSWVTMLARNEIWTLNEWEKGQLTSRSS